MLLISQELEGLSRLPVAQAAKERGWAFLQDELERRPAGATAARDVRPSRSAKGRGRRWGLASAAASIAVIATLIGAYGGGLLQIADNGPDAGGVTVTSAVDPGTAEPSTTVTTEHAGPDGTVPGATEHPEGVVTTGASDTTLSPDTTGTQPGITPGPGTTGGVRPTTPTTGSNTGGAPATTDKGPATTKSPTTVKNTTTTSPEVYTSAQREAKARSAVESLGEMVSSGNSNGARALVASEAQSSLSRMLMTLNRPFGYRVVPGETQSLSASTVRVVLQIDDRVLDVHGEWKEVVARFAVKVRVDDRGAVITAINAG